MKAIKRQIRPEFFRFSSVAAGLFVAFSSMANAQTASDVRSALRSQRASPSVVEFYAARGDAPVWIANRQPTSRLQELPSALAGLERHGLPSSDYWSSQLAEVAANAPYAQSPVSDEIKLTQAFLKACEHVAIGRIEPELAGAEVKFVRRKFTDIAEIAKTIEYYSLDQIFDSVAPQNAYYREMSAMLSRLREIQARSPFGGISPSNQVLKIGVRAPIVRQLKLRLGLLGHQIYSLDDVFDQDLATAIRSIQKSNLAKVTGQLSPRDQATWEFFSVSSARRVLQTELNMEKARWLPKQLEERHIIVNLATQRMRVADPNLRNPVLIEQNVVVGRPDRKTPSMREDMEYVVFNPTWTVPPDIFRLDKVPAIQNAAKSGPASITEWFTTNRMALLDRNEKPIDPTQFSWLISPPKYGNVLIRQQPGTTNALGTMKFMMPNPYSIYLHDTNQPELLKEDFRMLSSGCIRLNYPRDFAEYLLTGTKWSRPVIDDFVVKPGETRASESWVRLPNKVSVPVYLISLTTNLDNNQVMQFTRDVYGQNAQLQTALKSAGYYSSLAN